jgi:hypothetical protein
MQKLGLAVSSKEGILKLLVYEAFRSYWSKEGIVKLLVHETLRY